MRTHLIGGPHHGQCLWPSPTDEHFEYEGATYQVFKRATRTELWHGMNLVAGDALAEHVQT